MHTSLKSRNLSRKRHLISALSERSTSVSMIESRYEIRAWRFFFGQQYSNRIIAWAAYYDDTINLSR